MNEPINLEKGQKIDLTKGSPDLKHIMIGAGWSPNKSLSKSKFDLDLFALLLKNKKLAATSDVIYFRQLIHSSKSVTLDKDNLTGEGEGDDEKIHIDLTKVPSDITEINICINIYEAAERKQNFGMVEETFVRIVNEDTKAELVKYNPSENYSTNTGLTAVKLYRDGPEWKLQAVGEGFNGTIADIAKQFS